MFDFLGVLSYYFESVGMYLALAGAVVAVIYLTSALKSKDIDGQLEDFKKRGFTSEPGEDFIILGDFTFPENAYMARRDGEKRLRSSEYSLTK